MFLLLFFLVNLLFLTRFPFVHSDESWLAGLTRNMMQLHSLRVTETFFNLKPRWPHAIKSLFHLLQMPFIAVFGYRIFSVRLLSLLGGCLVLILFWNAQKRLAPDGYSPLWACLPLACDVQFLYAAHFARQEILLCAAICACMLLFLRQDGMLPDQTVCALAVVTGLSIGLHPNSFLIACLCGCIFITRILLFHTASFRQLGMYTVVTCVFAAIFVAVSFWMDHDFIRHYLAYGENEFDLLVPVTGKAAGLWLFFQKLWYGVSGTYYLPDIRFQMLLFPFLLLCALAYAVVMYREDSVQSGRLSQVLSAVFGILLGTVLIGRYNQTSIVFFTPLCWLLFPFVCTLFGKKTGKAVFTGCAAIVLLLTAQNVRPWLSQSYNTYLGQIAEFVPPDAKVLGNLNSDFYFKNGCLLDYRNLGYLKENGNSFAAYVHQNQITYLLISDELESIYAVRPKWNMIYGNLYGCYEQMQAFIQSDCTEVGHFQNPVYGVRIREWMNTQPYGNVTIYRINP